MFIPKVIGDSGFASRIVSQIVFSLMTWMYVLGIEVSVCQIIA